MVFRAVESYAAKVPLATSSEALARILLKASATTTTGPPDQLQTIVSYAVKVLPLCADRVPAADPAVEGHRTDSRTPIPAILLGATGRNEVTETGPATAA